MRAERWVRRAAAGSLVASLIAVPAGESGAAGASGRLVTPARVLSFEGGAARLQSGPASGAFAPGVEGVPAATARVRVRTVDPDSWTGYENAVYAADASTVYVAYKRFLQDPRQQEYTPAELRVAKSIDGGKTWSITTVDPDAIEDSQVLDGTVSIDGDGGSTIYVAYHTRSSGLYASMRLELAISTDGGANWTIHDIATSNAGDYNAIRVLDANRVVIAAHGAGGDAEGLHVYVTKDGGATFSNTTVESGIGLGIYNGIGASDTRHMIADDYDSLSDNTNLHGDRYRARSHTWRTTIIDGQPGVGLTGLGASLTMPAASRAYAAYEQDVSDGPYVKVATTTDGGKTWSPAVVEKNPTIGWNTAVDAVGSADVFVSYWWVGSGNVTQAHLGASHDGGATWKVLVVPEERSVQPYIDLSAVAGRRFVSYQSSASDGTAPLLRIAVFG